MRKIFESKNTITKRIDFYFKKNKNYEASDVKQFKDMTQKTEEIENTVGINFWVLDSKTQANSIGYELHEWLVFIKFDPIAQYIGEQINILNENAYNNIVKAIASNKFEAADITKLIRAKEILGKDIENKKEYIFVNFGDNNNETEN